MAECEGALCKWTNVMRGWAWRWFVLSDNVLTYYTTKDKRAKGDKRGSIPVRGALLSIEEDTNFSLTVDDHTYHFQAPDKSEQKRWIDALELCIETNQQHNQSLKNTGNILRQIEEAQQYLALCEVAQQKIKSDSSTDTLGALLSGLVQNGSDCALRLLEAAGQENTEKLVPSVSSGILEESQSSMSNILNQDEETLTSSDDEFLDAEEGDESIMEPDEFMQEDNDRGGGEDEGMEQHKSVIMHLIKQVRIGMDLTKVVLPTFILERRSLLEMYSDFFAHADFYSDIPNCANPRDRLIQVVKWYLTSFHAGRNGSVAKKPYNPILGESFRCFWRPEPSAESTGQNKRGPVPWSNNGDVCFVAEQVSHHPPISAFYAENKEKSIQFTAHIWTKSKFLGMSIGVENEGFGLLELLDIDETYRINFPSGYCRSILTVPWVELGGECQITSSTGYRADVKFHTKPMFGGKLHRVTCCAFEPNASKPFAEFEGNWNAEYHWTIDKEGPNEFVDTRNISTKNKMVKVLSQQEPTESRRLWKDVTENLKTNDIEQATVGKRRLEQKQRDDAKYRLENNIVYQTRLFTKLPDDQGWRYNNDLKTRRQNE